MHAATQSTRESRSGTPILAALALLTLAVHFLTNRGYDYFRDEFYYIACGRHLAWGYVDHPPFVALIAALTRVTIGQSLFALRLPTALAHAVLVFVTGLIARRMGGDRFAQGLAALAVLIGPVYLGSATTYSMNSFEQMDWALGALALIIAIQDERPRLWLWFGAIIGFGLLNKHSIAFFVVAIFIGLLLTRERKWFATRWPWLAGAIAALIFLPNLLWEIRHGWPTLEFLHNATARKNYSGSIVEFLGAQVLLIHPLVLPLWLLGFVSLCFSRETARLRWLAWAFVFVIGLIFLSKGKSYYVSPVFPFAIAAGAAALSRFLLRRRWMFARPVIASVLVLGGAAIAPFCLPILPPETFIRYAHALHIKEPQTERHRPAKLPQLFADMFGWEEMVASVARVYHGLTPEEQARCIIFTSNYGEAGAIDFFGAKYGLPRACSGHNNYYLWGPTNPNADIVITVGESMEDVGESFEHVEQAATFSHEYNMPYESDLPILIGRVPKMSWREIWPNTREFI